MKYFAVLLLIVPLVSLAQVDTISYGNGVTISVEDFAKLSDSLTKAKSTWTIATVDDLRKLQAASEDQKINDHLGFQGVYWISPIEKIYSFSGCNAVAKYCFISNNIFKILYSTDYTTASVLLIKNKR